MSGEKNKHKLKFQILIAFITLFFLFSIFQYVFGFEGYLKSFLESIKDTKMFLAIYLSLFVISSFFPIPFLTFFGATVFTFEKAFIYSVLGNVLAFVLLFYVASWLGKDYLNDYVAKKPKLKKLKFDLEKKSFLTIVFLRFFYIIPTEFVCILGGISNMGFWKYSLASLLGSLPVTIGSIMLIHSSQTNNPKYMAFSFIIMGALLIIPLFGIPKLRSFVKSSSKKKV